VREMRGRSLNGCRLQTDYASHECRDAFFDHCKKSGMDIRERAKPWEQEETNAAAERRSDSAGIIPDPNLNIWIRTLWLDTGFWFIVQ